MQEIETLFPQVMKQIGSNLRSEIDPQKLIVSKLAGFSSDKLEELVNRGMGREFRLAGFCGALVGFIIGLLQLLLTWLLT